MWNNNKTKSNQKTLNIYNNSREKYKDARYVWVRARYKIPGTYGYLAMIARRQTFVKAKLWLSFPQTSSLPHIPFWNQFGSTAKPRIKKKKCGIGSFKFILSSSCSQLERYSEVKANSKVNLRFKK